MMTTSDKYEFVTAIALIAILGFLGYRLSTETRSLIAQREIAQSLLSDNQRQTFDVERGIDVSGAFVSPLPEVKANRTIIFLLRGSSLNMDLDFWTTVNALLPVNPKIRLVAYCDSSSCIDLVRKAVATAKFPIIAYGEVRSTQALVNADIQGYAVVRSEEWIHPKLINWRNQSIKPSDIILESM